MNLASGSTPSQSEIRRIDSCRTSENYKECEKLLLHITELYPDYPIGWEVLSEIYAKTDKKTDSVRTLKRLRSLLPKDPEIARKLGALLLELNYVDRILE